MINSNFVLQVQCTTVFL